MTEKNIMDIATDILKERLEDAYAELAIQYHKKRPYRKEPVSVEERLFKYSQITPEQLDVGRREFGDEVVDAYLNSMQKTLNRREGQRNG